MVRSKSPIGSLIRLKKEYTHQYIVLHKKTFPAVLDRIAKSNIANYSIFLSDGFLFGFYDYLGENYEKDMKAVGEDEATLQWWKLTEPMQNPLRDRKKGAWWTDLEHLHSFSMDTETGKAVTRKAFRAPDLTIRVEEYKKLFDQKMIDPRILRAETFRRGVEIYIYAEIKRDEAGHLHPLKIETEWPQSVYFKEMEEVFHTDGCLG